MKTKRLLLRLVCALACAAAMTALAASGFLSAADGAASDRLYQRPGGTDGEIVVIGIDQRALEELGPFPWPREYMADALAYLNADPDNRPAAIGVDVLYVGASTDPDADAYLATVAEDGGNIVFGEAATFGSAVVESDEGFYMDDFAVVAWDRPFDALYAVSEAGHINAMKDDDGILRHALLYVDVPGGAREYSFSRRLYEKWCAFRGETPNPLPETDARGFFYLPFTARPGAYYDSVSVLDLLTGDIGSDYFAGKIVLIGPYAAGLQDEYVTSVNHAAPMYGVEIQANLIDAYRAGFVPREANARRQLALLFALCALAALFFWDRRLRSALPVWLAAAFGWPALCMLLRGRGVLLHVLYVPLFVTALFVASVALNYVRTAREKHRVQQTF